MSEHPETEDLTGRWLTTHEEPEIRVVKDRVGADKWRVMPCDSDGVPSEDMVYSGYTIRTFWRRIPAEDGDPA